ncbi:MAG: hypothetical protein L0Z53_09290, partial [Acidobacteriales bacterium]|nr:hypothetical protein [Terriglobales bacterium]
MIRKVGLAVCIGIMVMGAPKLLAQDFSSALVFAEPGFPAADFAAPTAQQLQSLLPGAKVVSAKDLAAQLKFPTTRLLVLAYGSVFPEEAWPSIFEYLRAGGNLLALGGRPFTRAAYRDGSGWRLRDYSVRFTRQLQIDQYQATPGSDGLEFQNNSDMVTQIPQFSWKQAFSPIIRLSAVDLYKRGGSAGSIDARLDAFAWGMRDGRKLAAPAIQIDHLRNGFNGGRWVFLSAELPQDFFSGPESSKMITTLAEAAIAGSHEFIVRPVLPLYLPNEPVEVRVDWQSAATDLKSLSAQIAVYPEAKAAARTVTKVELPAARTALLPVPAEKGLHIIESELRSGEKVIARYRSGFWVRDEAFLRSGPRVTVNRDYFELDGRPLAVVGTTYMASDVQRLFFEHSNVYVWNRDLEQISQAGLNMIRTGWWTGWEKFCDQNGQPYERTLRTLEAYLMTARKHGLPVQFNFFAFLPEVLGGANPYLDPEAVRKQRTLISSVVARFHDVPYLAWDFINEPSISQHLWRTRPNGDAIELARWNQWLERRYPNRNLLAAAWNVPPATVAGTLTLPEEIEFTPRGAYVGRNSLKLYDYYLFAQESFAEWTRTMREAVRSTGSQQLITVGQDEGGIRDRLSPAFWGPLVSFTTNHSWWENDSLLWDSVFAKQPGLPLLIQETGLQRELNLDETSRRTPESEAALLERKVALAFVQSGGTIQWLWHSNAYMTEGNETPIGAVRSDGTEKPEATVMRDMANFAKQVSEQLREPKLPDIAIVASQAAQFSVLGDLQVEAQRKAVRTLAYNARLAAYAVAENQIEKLGMPKLAILPSPQALSDSTWRTLLKYVEGGGNLLVTGPVERDEHWQRTPRASGLKLAAQAEPLTHRQAEIRLGKRSVPISFDQQKQSWLEWLHFGDGSSFKEISHGQGRIFWSANPVELA